MARVYFHFQQPPIGTKLCNNADASAAETRKTGKYFLYLPLTQPWCYYSTLGVTSVAPNHQANNRRSRLTRPMPGNMFLVHSRCMHEQRSQSIRESRSAESNLDCLGKQRILLTCPRHPSRLVLSYFVWGRAGSIVILLVFRISFYPSGQIIECSH